MKEERIVEILGMVDEKYVEEATPAPALKKKVYYGWMKWAVAAACVIGISWFGYNHLRLPQQLTPIVSPGVVSTPAPTTVSEVIPTSEPIVEPIATPVATSTEAPVIPNDGLPLLTVELNDGGMGFEGLLLYDISESSSVNPWTKAADIKTLPVYGNLAYTDGAGMQVWYSNEELYAKVEEVATRLDIDVLSVEYERVPADSGVDVEQERSCMIKAQTSCGEIEVDGNGMVRVWFEPAIEIPKEYSFTWYDTSTEEAYETIHYLLEQYSDLCTWEQYTVDTWGDYSFSGDYGREYDAFETGVTIEEQILNYNFERISFVADWKGKLSMIDFGNQLDCAEELGRYPIISWETAQSLLLNGDYITSVPEEYLSEGKVKEEDIAKVELIYRSGYLEKVFMPYYRFFVELPKIDGVSMAEGLKDYGAFYVPAVSGDYLVNFPVWDGGFN